VIGPRSTLIYLLTPTRRPELNQLTGIAAILTFPLDVEVVEAEEKAAKEVEEGAAADAMHEADGAMSVN
jgi:hypothetical protein